MQKQNNTLGEINKVTTLIVDDDEDIVESLKELLSLYDFTIVGSARDGQEAVDLYSKLRPDLVLLDVMMPVYDGIYAMKNIQKINPSAKIIMITGDVRHETLEKLRDANVSVLQKPFNVDQLISLLQKTAKTKDDYS
jgi:CheY-like chemotaxis protein